MKRLRYAGFAFETTYNPETPPAAGFHVDIASTSLDTPDGPVLVYGGGLGRSRRTMRPGYYAPSGNIAYAFDVRTIAFMLRATLGGYAFSAEGGSGTLNLHEIYGTDEDLLPSFTARLGKDLFEHVFAGGVAGQLQLATEGEYAVATVDVSAARDSRAALLDIGDLQLPDEFPLAFHEVTLELGGQDRSARVRSSTLTIANNPDVDDGRRHGSRHPREIPAGEREVSLELGLAFADLEQLERFWGHPDGPAADGAAEFPGRLVYDAGDDGRLSVDLPRLYYSQVQQQPSGRDRLQQPVTAQALADTVTLADSSEVSTEILAAVENTDGDLS